MRLRTGHKEEENTHHANAYRTISLSQEELLEHAERKTYVSIPLRAVPDLSLLRAVRERRQVSLSISQ